MSQNQPPPPAKKARRRRSLTLMSEMEKQPEKRCSVLCCWNWCVFLWEGGASEGHEGSHEANQVNCVLGRGVILVTRQQNIWNDEIWNVKYSLKIIILTAQNQAIFFCCRSCVGFPAGNMSWTPIIRKQPDWHTALVAGYELPWIMAGASEIRCSESRKSTQSSATDLELVQQIFLESTKRRCLARWIRSFWTRCH